MRKYYNILIEGTQYGRCETGGKWIFHRENCKDLRDPLVTIRLRNNWLMETFIESECQTQIKKVRYLRLEKVSIRYTNKISRKQPFILL